MSFGPSGAQVRGALADLTEGSTSEIATRLGTDWEATSRVLYALRRDGAVVRVSRETVPRVAWRLA